MPVDATPAAEAAAALRIAVSPAFELFWLCLRLVERKERPEVPAERLRVAAGGLVDELAGFWEEPGDLPELLVLAAAGGALFDIPAADVPAAAADASTRRVEAALVTEPPHVRELVAGRLARLQRDAGLRAAWADLLARTWAVAADDWQGHGEAAAQRAVDRLARRVGERGALESLAPTHFARRAPFDEPARRAAAAGTLALTAVYHAGTSQFLFELPGVVVAGLGASGDSGIPARRDEAEDVAARLKVLSDPTRILLVTQLTCEELTVSELAELFELSQPTVSVHVQKLRAAGLVTSRRDGGRVVLSAVEGAVDALVDDARRALGAICS